MLLFFSIICIVLIFLIILVRFSEVKIVIKKYKLISDKNNFKPIYEGKIGLYFVGKVQLIGIKIGNEKNKIFSENKFINKELKYLKQKQYYNKEKQKIIKKEILKLIKNHLKLESLNLKIDIGNKNIFLTSIFVGIISSVIPNIIRTFIVKDKINNIKFEILPVYNKNNYLSLDFNSIISIKLVHIINMLKTIGGIQDERTPNRSFNANCYGKY